MGNEHQYKKSMRHIILLFINYILFTINLHWATAEEDLLTAAFVPPVQSHSEIDISVLSTSQPKIKQSPATRQ